MSFLQRCFFQVEQLIDSGLVMTAGIADLNPAAFIHLCENVCHKPKYFQVSFYNIFLGKWRKSVKKNSNVIKMRRGGVGKKTPKKEMDNPQFYDVTF